MRMSHGAGRAALAMGLLMAIAACGRADTKALPPATVVAMVPAAEAAPAPVEPAPAAAAPDAAPAQPAVAAPRDAGVWLSADVPRMARRAQEIAEAHGQAEPVAPEKLAELIPPPPFGWSALGDANGHFAQRGGVKIATADRMYSRGSDVLHVQIVDGAYHAPVSQPMTSAARQPRREKGGTVSEPGAFAGYPAIETVAGSTKGYDLSVFVGSRFLVTVRGSGFDRVLGRAVWASIDRDRLAALQ
ncbi:MAG: hypothetical protein ABJD07_04025 [Gemmatimonadaceae bacterium]